MNLLRKNSGQVLLIVIITMIVALTAGLSLASRTITNLKLSKQNEDSQRAFQAASAGIDKYINSSSGGTQNNPNLQFTTSVSTVSGQDLLLNNGGSIDQDRGIDVWLSTYPGYADPKFTGTITLYWGSSNQTNCAAGSGGNTRPALEIVTITGFVAAPTVNKYIYDRCSNTSGTGRITGLNISPSGAGGTFNGVTYDSSATLLVANGLIMKIIPLYNSTIIGLHGSIAFPPQGKVIQSTGKSGDSARKIIYFESYPQIPNEVFPYVILSQN